MVSSIIGQFLDHSPIPIPIAAWFAAAMAPARRSGKLNKAGMRRLLE
jgi:hypothetical protein